jgi:hypothetical protein
LLWLFWRWESRELFAQAGLKPQSSQYQVAWISGVRRHARHGLTFKLFTS